MIRRLLMGVGGCLFVAAFFLPAVTSAETGAGSGPVRGWVCALVATGSFAGVFRGLHSGLPTDAIFLMLSGLVNPLLLVYLLFCIWPGFVRVRRVMCVAILACMVGPWAYFHLEHFIPLIGHYLWVSGIVIILAGGFVGRFEKGAQG